MNDMTEIVILEHESASVYFIKVKTEVLEKKFGNDPERYIREHLHYNPDTVSWMSGTCISCTMYDGAPSGGLIITGKHYFE